MAPWSARLLSHAASVSPGYGFGSTYGIEYLFSTRAQTVRAVGVSATTRGLLLVAPGEHGTLDPLKTRRDIQVDLGVVATLF